MPNESKQIDAATVQQQANELCEMLEVARDLVKISVDQKKRQQMDLNEKLRSDFLGPVLSFFDTLSPREKLICKTFNELLCSEMAGEVQVQNVVDGFDREELLQQPETAYLLGVHDTATIQVK